MSLSNYCGIPICISVKVEQIKERYKVPLEASKVFDLMCTITILEHICLLGIVT